MWTPEDVRERFVEAADIEHRMLVKGMTTGGNAWPSYVYTREDYEGWDDAARANNLAIWQGRKVTKSAEITRWEECFFIWTGYIKDPRARRTVWIWAHCMRRGTWYFGHPDPMPPGRDCRVQVSEGLLVIEPGALRHEAFYELQYTIGPVHKATEDLARIGIDSTVAIFVEQPFGFRRPFGRRQIEKGQEIAQLIMSASLLELRPSLRVDQRGRGTGKRIGRIGSCGMTLRLDKDQPPGAF